jgi:hypothetical protein
MRGRGAVALLFAMSVVNLRFRLDGGMLTPLCQTEAPAAKESWSAHGGSSTELLRYKMAILSVIRASETRPNAI